MRKKKPLLALALPALLAILHFALAAAVCAQAQSTIAQWNFSSASAAPDNSPAPTAGTGSASTLGMDNTYNGGNTASDDVLLTAGTANPGFSEYTWRIRGTPYNGWATFQSGAGAPEYTQGIELDVSTVGYQNITFSFDWYSTIQGIRDLQFQYNLNDGAGWQNFGGTSPTGTYVATPNDYYNAPGSPTISINLSSIAGANNNPNLGVRLVSAFDSTGTLVNEYASAASPSSGPIVPYNNSSGNWRFGNLTFTGYTNVPPPPLLSITRAGNSAIVSWPSPSTGYVLQTNSNLATTNWVNFAGSVTTNLAGTSNTVAITPPAGTLFFRLGPQ